MTVRLWMSATFFYLLLLVPLVAFGQDSGLQHSAGSSDSSAVSPALTPLSQVLSDSTSQPADSSTSVSIPRQFAPPDPHGAVSNSSAAAFTLATDSLALSDGDSPTISWANTLGVMQVVAPPDSLTQPTATECLWYDITIGILMVIMGSFATVTYKGLGHPELEITLADVTDRFFRRHGNVRFLHVAVLNNPRRVPFVTKETAHACEAFITFVSSAGTRIGPMPGRWAGQPEPLRYEGVNDEIRKVPDFALMVANRLVDIPPSRSRRLDIAMRRARDQAAYGWTDTSYLHDWRQESFGYRLIRILCMWRSRRATESSHELSTLRVPRT